MKVVIKVIAVTGPDMDGVNDCLNRHDIWLKNYVDTPDGRGEAAFTPDKTQAMKFDFLAEALDFYRQTSKYVPLRDDGKPNRPLTAYTVEIGS